MSPPGEKRKVLLALPVPAEVPEIGTQAGSRLLSCYLKKIFLAKLRLFFLLYLCFLAVSLRFELNLEHGIILNMDFE